MQKKASVIWAEGDDLVTLQTPEIPWSVSITPDHAEELYWQLGFVLQDRDFSFRKSEDFDDAEYNRRVEE